MTVEKRKSLLLVVFVVSLLLVVCGVVALVFLGDREETTPASSVELRFPLAYSLALIELDDDDPIEMAWNTSTLLPGFTVSRYVNRAYNCGAEGYYSFIVVEPTVDDDDSSKRRLGLWVILRGGGGGYFDPQDQSYWIENSQGVQNVAFEDEGGRRQNRPESNEALLDVLRGHVDGSNGATTLEHRIRSRNWRFLVPSLCDHDSFLGMHHEYPHNPYSVDATVDGLVASLAAISFASQQQPGPVVLHGVSSGAFGAYAVAYSLEQEGHKVNGVLADSGLMTTGLQQGFSVDCRQVGLDYGQLDLKNGPFWQDAALFAQSTFADASFSTPFFDLWSDNDAGCCGDTDNHIPIQNETGIDDNCAFVHGFLADVLPASDLYQSRMVRGGGHVISDRPGIWTEWIEDWVNALAIKNATGPWE